jgi:hypothetical protein
MLFFAGVPALETGPCVYMRPNRKEKKNRKKLKKQGEDHLL